MDHLEHIHAVEAAEKALVAGIVRARMAHLGIDPHLIVAMKKFAEQKEFRFQRIREASKALQKVPIEAVGYVESEPVDAEILDPVADLIEDMADDGRISKIELNQIEASFPAFVPEPVVIVRVSVKRDVEPVLVG